MKNKIFSVLFLLLCGVFFSCNNEVDGGGGNGGGDTKPIQPEESKDLFKGNTFEGQLLDGSTFGTLVFGDDGFTLITTAIVTGNYSIVDNIATLEAQVLLDGEKSDYVSITTTVIENNSFLIEYPLELIQQFGDYEFSSGNLNESGTAVPVKYSLKTISGVTSEYIENKGVKISIDLPENIYSISIRRNKLGQRGYTHIEYYCGYDNETGEQLFFDKGNYDIYDEFVDAKYQYTYTVELGISKNNYGTNYEYGYTKIVIPDNGVKKDFDNIDVNTRASLIWEQANKKFRWNMYPTISDIPEGFEYYTSISYSLNDDDGWFGCNTESNIPNNEQDDIYIESEFFGKEIPCTSKQFYIEKKSNSLDYSYTYFIDPFDVTGIPESITLPSGQPLELEEVENGVKLTINIPYSKISNVYIYRDGEDYMYYSLDYDENGDQLYYPLGEISFMDYFVDGGKEYSYYVDYSYSEYNEGTGEYEYTDLKTEIKTINVSESVDSMELDKYQISNDYSFEWTPLLCKYSWTVLPTITPALPSGFEGYVSLEYEDNNKNFTSIRSNIKKGSCFISSDDEYYIESAKLTVFSNKLRENETVYMSDLDVELPSNNRSIKREYASLLLSQNEEGVQLSVNLPNNVKSVSVYRNKQEDSFNSYMDLNGEFDQGNKIFTDSFVEPSKDYEYYLSYYIQEDDCYYTAYTTTQTITISESVKYCELENYTIEDYGILNVSYNEDLDWYECEWTGVKLNKPLPDNFKYTANLYYRTEDYSITICDGSSFFDLEDETLSLIGGGLCVEPKNEGEIHTSIGLVEKEFSVSDIGAGIPTTIPVE